MKVLKKLAILILIPAAILAFGIWRIQVARSRPPAVKQRDTEPFVSQDDSVMPRKMYIDTLASAKALVGKPVWMKAGYEFDDYPYANHRIDFAKSAGVIPSIQEMQIRDFVLQKVPATLPTRIPQGDKQIFAVFTLGNDPKQYATAVGYMRGGDSTFYCDQMFYYDDPHQLYHFWPANIWQAIDRHHPIDGMNELQTQLALGVIQQSESSDVGNRTVYYDAGPTHWSVTFENGAATHVQQQPASAAK